MSEQKIKSEEKKEKKIFYRKIETEGIFISFDILSAGFVKFDIFGWPLAFFIHMDYIYTGSVVSVIHATGNLNCVAIACSL